jgi:phosphinothricin acetyltransferase
VRSNQKRESSLRVKTNGEERREKGGRPDPVIEEIRLVECDRTRSPEILAILNEAIEHSTALYDYKLRTLPMMDAWFDAKAKGAFPVIGAVDEAGRLRGFGTYGTFRDRPAYKYSVEHSVYVERDSRGHGIGRRLLTALIERARAQDYHTLIGGIDAENTVSIDLHRKLGFTFCGEIRDAGFKFNRWLHLHFYQLVLDTPVHPVDG